MIFEDGELKSQQFRTDIGIIDILAKDKNDDSFVVIELKKNQTSDDLLVKSQDIWGGLKKNIILLMLKE